MRPIEAFLSPERKISFSANTKLSLAPAVASIQLPALDLDIGNARAEGLKKIS